MTASASQAGIITLSANDFASGTDVSNAFDDVTLSSFARDLTKEPIPGQPVPFEFDPVYAVSRPRCLAHGSSTSAVFGASTPAMDERSVAGANSSCSRTELKYPAR